MKRVLTTALLLAACAFIISLVYNKLPIPRGDENIQGFSVQSVELADQTIQVTVADSPREREIGLSGRRKLAGDEGMLFVFPENGKYAFWMKDMLFSIDILWLSEDEVVVDVAENVSPETYPAVYTPRVEARYVLELPVGSVLEYGVRVGDVVRL